MMAREALTRARSLGERLSRPQWTSRRAGGRVGI
jgi:hypothetical protein